MSPFLFLLVVKYLSRLIQSARLYESLKGDMVLDSEELSHILLVDDVLMLGEGSLENIQTMSSILGVYKGHWNENKR